MSAAGRHTPVLTGEVLTALAPERGGLFIDCTLGMGGHSEALLQANEGVRVLGIDRDAESIALATERLAQFGERFTAVHADYREIGTLVEARGEPAAGVLADFGISSYQLDEADRGFAFAHDAPLDMRMDRSQGVTAADLVNSLPDAELADIIYRYGEERASRRIARAICRARERGPIRTTRELAEIVARASGIPRHKQRIHPATRTFQALRIAVNDELSGLDRFLGDAVDALASPGGRIAVISFHSLEDRIVKRFMRTQASPDNLPKHLPLRSTDLPLPRLRLVGKPVKAGAAEIAANPRARSAVMRVAEKLVARLVTNNLAGGYA